MLGAIMPESPKISVILPTFNASQFISDSVHSILGQTFSNFELLIIDDGSTDNTKLIIQSIQKTDQRIKYIQLEHSGIVDALNLGLQIAVGKYIARMDADDVALPERFEKQVHYLERNPDCVIVSNAVGVIDERGRFLGTFTEQNRGPFSPGDDDVSRILDVETFLLHPTVMYRKDCAVKVGGYRKEFEWIEDADLYTRLAKEGRMFCLPWVLIHYRVHLNSVTRTKAQIQHNLKIKLAVELSNQNIGMLAEVSQPTNYSEDSLSLEAQRERKLGFLRTWSYLSRYHGGSLITSFSLAIEALAIAPINKQNWITLLLILFGDRFVAALVHIRKVLLLAARIPKTASY
jgi:glycosyltransferase involved in cell wall biosynthesis